MLHKTLVTNQITAMKNTILKLYSAVAVVALLFATSCNETVSIDETISVAPIIESFSPATAVIGSEIEIFGEALNGVLTAEIGGQEVTILKRTSNTQMTILADITGVDGAITLSNTVGSSTSSESFTYEYAAPSVADDCQAAIVMGERMLIAGEGLAATSKVFFLAADGSDDTQYEATINQKSNTEIVVTVPYVSSDDAKLYLEYKSGAESTVELNTNHAVVIRRDKPTFEPLTVDTANAGRSVTITGTFLDKVNYIEVGNEAKGFNKASISTQTYDELTFTIPNNDNYADGDNTDQEIKAVYFDGWENNVLSTSFKVYVPKVYYWENILTSTQSRETELFVCFFCPETGSVIPNADWQAHDVTSVAKSGLVSMGSNSNNPDTANITEEEYYAVKPYFFFTVFNSGDLVIYSPNNSNTQLKNFYYANDSKTSITGGGSWFGTPAITYKWIDPNASTQAEKDLYNKVVNGEIDEISPETFPINAEAQTIGDLSVLSLSASIKDSVYAPGVFSNYYPSKNPNYESFIYGDDEPCDIVIMVIYHTYDKKDSAHSVPLDKVRRIGFVHIKQINYAFDSNKVAKKSTVLYNCYWQKYDYDYTKL